MSHQYFTGKLSHYNFPQTFEQVFLDVLGVLSRSKRARELFGFEVILSPSIGLPGTCLSFVLGVEPSKRMPFFNQTRVIWVPTCSEFNEVMDILEVMLISSKL